MKRLIILILTAVFVVMASTALAEDAWKTTYDRVHTAVATGSGAMAVNVDPNKAFKLLEMRVHLSSASATSEDLTITLDSGAGAAYDVELYSKDMNTVVDLVVTFTDRYFISTDDLDFAWANSNSRTYGIEIKYQLID